MSHKGTEKKGVEAPERGGIQAQRPTLRVLCCPKQPGAAIRDETKVLSHFPASLLSSGLHPHHFFLSRDQHCSP